MTYNFKKQYKNKNNKSNNDKSQTILNKNYNMYDLYNVNNKYNVVVFIGPMYAGKTTKLIEYYNNSNYKNKLVIRFANDNRYTVSNELCTHDKKKLNACSAYNINQIDNILEYYYEIDNILFDEIYIDEAQLYDGDIYTWYMNSLSNFYYSNIKNIFMSSLDYDAERLIFDKKLEKLINTKNNVYTIHLFSRCYKCNKKAYFTKKINKNVNYTNLDTNYNKTSKNILVGDVDIYQPSCNEHYFN
jgi:thymidine kinase